LYCYDWRSDLAGFPGDLIVIKVKAPFGLANEAVSTGCV